MTLAAGRLRHRVVLQSPTITRDSGTGAIIITWATQSTVWAAIEPVSVRDFIASDERQAKVTTRIIIRRHATIKPSWRVMHGSVIYQIAGILNDPDTGLEYQTIACAEGPTQGGQ